MNVFKNTDVNLYKRTKATATHHVVYLLHTQYGILCMVVFDKFIL